MISLDVPTNLVALLRDTVCSLVAPSPTCSLNVPSELDTFAVDTLVIRPLASTVITGTNAAEP